MPEQDPAVDRIVEEMERAERQRIQILDHGKTIQTMERVYPSNPWHLWRTVGHQSRKSAVAALRQSLQVHRGERNGFAAHQYRSSERVEQVLIADRVVAWRYPPDYVAEELVRYVYVFPSRQPLTVRGERLWPVLEKLAEAGQRQVETHVLRTLV